MSSDTTEILKTLFSHCKTGNLHAIRQLVQTKENPSGIHPGEQCEITGSSPLMIAAGAKQLKVVEYLLNNGAPWNALDKKGKCAGNYALEAENFDQTVIDTILNHAVKCELLLGSVFGSGKNETMQSNDKYLNDGSLRYSKEALIDGEGDGVMMSWETPIMQAHVQQLQN